MSTYLSPAKERKQIHFSNFLSGNVIYSQKLNLARPKCVCWSLDAKQRHLRSAATSTMDCEMGFLPVWHFFSLISMHYDSCASDKVTVISVWVLCGSQLRSLNVVLVARTEKDWSTWENCYFTLRTSRRKSEIDGEFNIIWKKNSADNFSLAVQNIAKEIIIEWKCLSSLASESNVKGT